MPSASLSKSPHPNQQFFAIEKNRVGPMTGHPFFGHNDGHYRKSGHNAVSGHNGHIL
jgi:hypothetical protein